MKWSIGVKIGAGFAFGMTLLVAMGALAYVNTTRLIAATERVTHTYEVRARLKSVVIAMAEAEAGVRGYMLTNDEAYLGPNAAAAAAIPSLFAEFRQMTADNPVQQKAVDDLEPLVSARLVALSAAISNHRATGEKAVNAVAVSVQGKRAGDDISLRVDAMIDEENRLLEARNATSKSQSDAAILVILIGIPAALVLIVLIAFLLIRSISGPLRSMALLSDRVAGGDLTVEVPHSNRGDEVGALYASLGIMVVNLRELLGSTQEGIGMMGSSASEILATTTQIASGAAETATGVSETTTTVEEVKQTVLLASQKAREVMEGAQLSVLVSEAGKKSIEETLAGMNRIREQMDLISGSIVRLSEQSQAIGEIIATVNDIAEQSNLLAVNAAIEAARAGDQGRGFAVVAQEVKDLAEQSKKATTQVRAILGDVQKATGVAVMAADKGSKVVDEGVRQSEEVSEVIRKLAESIAVAAQASTQIAVSSQQQVLGMDQVAQAMESIKVASSQNMAGTKQAENAARQLHEMGEKLQAMVLRYKLEDRRDARAG